MATLDFTAIAAATPFRSLLKNLDIGFEETQQGQLKFHAKNKAGQEAYFVVTEAKNLFFVPENESIKGGPINFISWLDGIKLYQAAKKLATTPTEPPEKREIPTLKLHPHESIEGLEHLLKHFEFGYCKAGVMRGKIAFQVKNPAGEIVGYVGKDIKTGDWFFPKGFKRPVYNIEKAKTNYCILVDTPFDVLQVFNMGYCFVCGLMGKTVTDYQAEQLKRFKYILLMHPNTQNIVPALSKFSYVKAPTYQQLEEVSQYIR